MSYLALARKYRPQTFEEIVGQAHISRTLQNAIRKDQVHHAFLFTGTRGVGKTTAARVLAKALNCQEGPSPIPCNKCSNCKEITGGANVDVMEIDGASNRGIDDVRELRDSVRYMPSASRFRIIIIDEVHMLTKEAFNALLKTLEEPPAHVKFIFATTDPHRLPETILSRVQRYDFREISSVEMQKYLAELTEKEGAPFSEDNLTLIVRKARGSMRDALSLLDQAISFGGADISVRELADLLGITDWRQLFLLSEKVLAQDADATLDGFEKVFQCAYDTRQFYLDLLEHFRNLVVACVAKEPGALMNATTEETGELVRLAQAHGVEHLQTLFRMLAGSEEEILRSANPKLVMEMTVLGMATMQPVVSIDQLLRRAADLGSGLAGPQNRPAAPAAATSVRAEPAAAAVAQEVKARPATGDKDIAEDISDPLERFRGAVARKSQATAALLTTENVGWLQISENEVHLQSKTGFFHDSMSRPEAKGILLDSARALLGPKTVVRLLAPKEDAASRVAAADKENTIREKRAAQAKARNEAIKNPVVRGIVDLFDGEITEVKIDTSKS